MLRAIQPNSTLAHAEAEQEKICEERHYSITTSVSSWTSRLIALLAALVVNAISAMNGSSTPALFEVSMSAPSAPVADELYCFAAVQTLWPSPNSVKVDRDGLMP